MGKKKTVKGIWRAAWPLLLYWSLSAAAVICAAVLLRFSMMESTLLANLICAPVFWLLYRKDTNRIQIYRGNYISLEIYTLVWAVSGVAALATLSNRLLSIINLPRLSGRFQEISGAMALEDTWVILLTSVVVAPVVEELVMRGVLYGRLRSIMSARAAILCSAVLFGIMHGNLVQGVHAFAIGALLAWEMERFGNIIVPILGHMAANLVPSLLVWNVEESYLMEMVICAACVGRTVQIIKGREED